MSDWYAIDWFGQEWFSQDWFAGADTGEPVAVWMTATLSGSGTINGALDVQSAAPHGGFGGFPHGAAKKRPHLSPLRPQPPRRAPSYAHANAVALALLLLED